MLLYHFGSRAGLLAAIVAENEARERALAASYAASATSAVDALGNSWQRLRQPAYAGEERLFFELAAMAMYRRPGTEAVAGELIERWIELAEDTGADPAQIRLDVAVIRGLLMDLLLTADRKGTDAAFEQYLRLRGGEPLAQMSYRMVHSLYEELRAQHRHRRAQRLTSGRSPSTSSPGRRCSPR